MAHKRDYLMHHTIYGKSDCLFCDKAKELLTYYNCLYNYVDIGKLSADQREYLIVTYNMKTVPIILDDYGKLIGGYKEVRTLYEKTSQ